MSVRVRFAPSPTGPLHIGGVRTALYNYLFAKKHKGTFILRIEDTDQTRYVEGAESYITEALEWLGLTPAESPNHPGEFGPYRQSERSDIYGKYVQQLIDQGKAYYAFDTAEELQKMREEKEAAGVHSPKYGYEYRMEMNNSLALSEEAVQEKLHSGHPYVVRLLIEPGHEITFEDEVRGRVTFSSDELDDKVLLKSDGLPTYHLANVVDDHLMQISHVIRGEEWLSSTPLHVLLYEAFGWKSSMPSFVHLPLILKPSGKGKLSKRDGAKFGFPVFPLEWKQGDEVYAGFREMGFLPQATLNFLALLGWNPGTEEEVMSLDDMAAQFSTEKINKSGARFDIEKAYWFNQQYIMSEPTDKMIELLQPMKPDHFPEADTAYLSKVLEPMRPRINALTEFWDSAAFFFMEVPVEDQKMIRKKWKETPISHWPAIIEVFENINSFEAISLERGLKDYMSEHELGFGMIFPLIRIALSGTTKGPDLFESMEILGQEEVVKRLNHAPTKFEEVITAS